MRAIASVSLNGFPTQDVCETPSPNLTIWVFLNGHYFTQAGMKLLIHSQTSTVQSLKIVSG